MPALLIVASLVGMACSRSKSETGEGPNESDPGLVQDTATDTGGGSGGGSGGGGGPGTGGTIDESDLPAIITETEACYLGPDRDNTVCLPTVEWSDEWGSAYAYPPPLDDDPQYSAPARFIDLEAATADPSLSLAPNFVLDELMQDYKGRFGLFQAHAVASLQDLRDRVGGPIYVNSGYRNVDYNAGVGGATWSRHQYGDAVDIRSDDASLEELAALCTELGAGFTSVYTSHVHCDWRRTPLDPAFYDVDGVGEAATEAIGVEVLRRADGRLEAVPTGFDEGSPRIRWRALHRDRTLVQEGYGRHFESPKAATHAELWVGGHLLQVVDLTQ